MKMAMVACRFIGRSNFSSALRSQNTVFYSKYSRKVPSKKVSRSVKVSELIRHAIDDFEDVAFVPYRLLQGYRLGRCFTKSSIEIERVDGQIRHKGMQKYISVQAAEGFHSIFKNGFKQLQKTVSASNPDAEWFTDEEWSYENSLEDSIYDLKAGFLGKIGFHEKCLQEMRSIPLSIQEPELFVTAILANHLFSKMTMSSFCIANDYPQKDSNCPCSRCRDTIQYMYDNSGIDTYFVKLITRQTNLTNHQDISEITHGNRYKEVIESSNNADVNLTFSMNTGIQVQTPTGSLIVKGHLLIASLDLPARAIVSNMKQFNGKSSCSICKDEGKSPAGNPMLRFFPYEQNSELRTHQSWVDDARKASDQGQAVNGIKGATALMMLPYIDLPKVFAVDWMHCILLDVTKALMRFWFDNKYKDKDFFIGNKMELLDKRYLSIKIPDFVSRRQRTLVDHNHWKASECREWLIHFSVPVLHGILGSTPYAHYILLATGISILVRDDLKSDDVNYAENLLADFCKVFPEIYGRERQTMNLHLVRHLADNVRMYGPLYCYSCFGFESMNSFLKDMVHGTRHINKQIGFAVAMSKQLTSIVRQFTKDNVDPKTKQLFVKLGSKFIQEEKPEDNSTGSLGRKIAVKDAYRYSHLITEEMKEKQPKTLGRVKLFGTTYKSEDYQQAKTRCDFVTSYYEGNMLRFGVILSFIEVEEQIFAVMKKCEVVPFMLNQRLMQTVTDPILKENFQKVLCGHISKIVSYGETVLIPSTNLRKKCILMKVTANLEFISVPPNILEHN